MAASPDVSTMHPECRAEDTASAVHVSVGQELPIAPHVSDGDASKTQEGSVEQQPEQCNSVDRKLTPENLTVMLEALLSRDALAECRDAFIVQHILMAASPDLAMPVASLQKHPCLTEATEEEILEAASRSSLISADASRHVVLPQLKSKRSTIILRETSPAATPKDILKLLAECPCLDVDRAALEEEPFDPLRCCAALTAMILHLDSWFLTFTDESIATNIAWWLRDQQLLGASVQVRIKAETALTLDLLTPAPLVSPLPQYGNKAWQPRRWTDTRKEHWSAGGAAASEKPYHVKGATPQDGSTTNQHHGGRPWKRGGRGGAATHQNRRGCRSGGHHDHAKTYRGSRSGKGHSTGATAAAATSGPERVVVVTPSEFPPLYDDEAADALPEQHKKTTGFRQHTMEEVRTICEGLTLDDLSVPPPAIAAALSESSNDHGLVEVITQAPRQHEWCFTALSQRTAASRLQRVGQKKAEGCTEDLKEDLNGVVLSEQEHAREFWARQRAKNDSPSPTTTTTASPSNGNALTCDVQEKTLGDASHDTLDVATTTTNGETTDDMRLARSPPTAPATEAISLAL